MVVSLGSDLQTTAPVTAHCGENVTLTCNKSSADQMELVTFTWLHEGETMCDFKHDQTKLVSGFRCERAEENAHKRLTLILYNVTPANKGSYLCKVHSNRGIYSNVTNVTVRDCPGIPRKSVEQIKSSGSIHKLPWMHVLIEIMMIRFFKEMLHV
ncbi:unnamed protein product [Menidia menidia]|uniref:(Atlantic silverside) hypothetical protein n=1 Tax=Menidia menidia TaxID=238744 RepID=A0A8S4AXP1_9TELE|nr:unnamed protein product [Menidia menidia]